MYQPLKPPMPPFRSHPTGICQSGYTLQINAMTNRQVCALPGSFPRFLADTGSWVMVPGDWVIVTSPTTGRLSYTPPPCTR